MNDNQHTKEKIIEFMKSFCVGHKKAMKYEKLADGLRIEPRLCRHLVEEIVHCGIMPIGGSTSEPYGYFIVENQKEYDMICADLKSCIAKLYKRLAGFEKAFSEIMGQEKMFKPGQFKVLGQQRIKEIINQQADHSGGKQFLDGLAEDAEELI